MPIPGNSPSAGKKPTTPTIVSATAGNASASVAFTVSTYIGKGTISYTATSNPSGITGASASSPITVSGLSNGTPYTFNVVGTTNYGVPSDASEFSNPVTPVAPPFFPFFPFFPPTCTQGACGPATVTGTSDGPYSNPAWSACSAGGTQTRTNSFVRTTFYTATCTNSDCSTYTSNTSSTATIYVPESQSCTPPVVGACGDTFGCASASGGPTRCGFSNCCDCSIDGCSIQVCCTPCGGIVSGGDCNPC